MDKKKTLVIIFILFLLLSIFTFFKPFSLFPPSIQDKYIYVITLQPRQQSDVYDVPIQLFLTEDNFNFEHLIYPNGQDIRFYDENGNLLQYYIVPRHGTTVLEIWVKIHYLPSCLKGENVTIYMGCGVPRGDASDKTIFTFLEDFEGGSPMWTGASSVTVDAVNVIEGDYSNRITWSALATGEYPAELNVFGGSKQLISFWAYRDTSYTGPDSAFIVKYFFNKVYYGQVRLRNDGSVAFGVPEVSSPPNVIPVREWRQVQIYMSSNYWKVMVRHPSDGHVIWKGSGQCCESSSEEQGAVLEVVSMSGSMTVPGSINFDFITVSTYCYPTVSYYYLQAVLTAEFIDYEYPLKLPPMTDIELRTLLTCGGNILPNTAFTFTVEPKEDYNGFSTTVTTDENGIGTVSFRTPSSLWSPYQITILVEGHEDEVLSYELTILKGLEIYDLDRPSIGYYSTGYDLVISGKLRDVETKNPVTSYSINLLVKGPEGKIISSVYEISLESFILKAKVGESYSGDYIDREITVEVTFEKSGYCSKHEVMTVLMKKSTITTSLVNPSSYVISTGHPSIKIEFISLGSSSPPSLGDDDVEIIITNPNGEKTFLSDMTSDIDYKWVSTPYETSVNIKYIFDIPGTYKIEVIFITINNPSQSYTITVQEASQFPIPTEWLILIGIAIVFYLLLRNR